VTGFSVGSSGLVEYATIKYNSAGQKVWVARYNNGPGNGEDHAAAIAVDSSGNVYVTGFSGGTGYDYATVKYNSAGQKVWVARYNGPGNGNDEAQGIAVDSSGNVYVTGFSASPSGFFDYATIKYNSMGTQQWVARYNNDPVNGDSIAYAMAIDSSGNVYVTGYSVGSDPRRFADYATVKYDSLHGTQQWVARYNNDPVNGNSIAYAMAIDGSGNVYVTGYSDGDRQTSADYATVKYGSLLGTQQWVARYNGSGSGYDRAEAIAIDRSGNVYVTGFSVGRGSYFDYATVKYDSAGVRQWVARYNGPGRSGDDEAQGIVVDGSGNVYVTGESQGSGTGYDYATIKYVQNPP
jgi:hypothetical protein